MGDRFGGMERLEGRKGNQFRGTVREEVRLSGGIGFRKIFCFATCREPRSDQANKRGILNIHPLDTQSYERYVLSPVKGMIALVLMVDNTTKQGEGLVDAYGKILARHRYGNLHLFFACYHKQQRWFFNLLSQSPQLTQTEVACRARGCVNGGVATAILLFGAKRQMALFPDKFDLVLKLCRGMEDKRREGRKEEGGDCSGGEECTREEDRRQEKRNEERASTDLGKVENVKSNRREVGGVLGSMFGYESSDEVDKDISSHSVEYGDSREVGVEVVHCRPAHEPHPPGGGSPSRLVEQVNTYFENWCERMGDGSLRRCGVEAWPEWTHS